jgi:Pyridoxamine 5'-phosphate oxidase
MSALAEIAPAFVAMAHRIVWCTVATVTPSGAPSSRVLHPIWEWDGWSLTGWVATSPQSPKAAHLASHPKVSLTYWDATHDTCTADCAASWENTEAGRADGWRRFAEGPEPVGYNPAIIPGWTSPAAPSFGVLRLTPERLRLMPGSLMLRGEGALLSWRA